MAWRPPRRPPPHCNIVSLSSKHATPLHTCLRPQGAAWGHGQESDPGCCTWRGGPCFLAVVLAGVPSGGGASSQQGWTRNAIATDTHHRSGGSRTSDHACIHTLMYTHVPRYCPGPVRRCHAPSCHCCWGNRGKRGSGMGTVDSALHLGTWPQESVVGVACVERGPRPSL